mmetsp:Transcript_30684/g.67394  ORF Transcript_30684/g.67394 Transcript_30684/m.67394 type:complete len:306 (-) Transcript_30684:194-1111(-)
MKCFAKNSAGDADWTGRQLMAEFIATSTFVWAGCGSAVAANSWTETSGVFDAGAIVGIALGFGITISVLAYGIGHLSGGHINPAVTFSFMVLKLQSIKAGLLYMLAQFSGAFLGALILWGCTSSLTAACGDGEEDINGVCESSATSDGGYGPAFGLGVNAVGPRVSSGSAFLIECMGTYLLVFTVLNTAVDSKSAAGNAAPIAIGWSVLVAHLVLVPFTGCGINPARSFGPMIVDTIGGLASSAWGRGWWVFYTAPFVGSGFAAATYKYLFEAEPDEAAVSKKDDDANVKDVEAGDGDEDASGDQ